MQLFLYLVLISNDYCSSDIEAGCGRTADEGVRTLLLLKDRAEILVAGGLDAESEAGFTLRSLSPAHPEQSQLLPWTVE